MCHELIKGPLVIVRCYDNNYCTYYEHGSSIIAFFGGPKVYDSFENEIPISHRNMQLEVIKVIKPFLQFLRTFHGG
jgi:hypothetical protein